MKSLILIRKIFVLSISILVIGSCSSDDDASPSNKNSIKFDGESFEILQASIIGVSLGGEGHAAISFTNGNPSLMKALTIDIEYFTDQSIEGDYAFPQFETQRLLNDWLTNYSEFDGTTNTSIHLQEGTLNVVHNGGNNYSITMNLTMDGEKAFSGTYTGEFEVFFNNS
ncbi:MAG: hypothetical protein KAK04_00925 [Cyclobacteriaceae bacterium]|nr:hypothetical protein [Cyclobacteriaceae bacterium]